MLYLDSIGLDFCSLIQHHPPIISASLHDLKSTVDFLASMNFTTLELRRILSMCPHILTVKPTSLLPVFTFLLREARVNGSDLKKVINRRPRLLACIVETQLRPTLYFLQSIGISEVRRHTYLLSCSVENKLIPRIEYFQKIGFSHRQSISMFRRFPQLFNYSIKENYEPKLNYFVVEMGRDLREIKEFPQYFSFSLENRIKPRHQICVEKGVCFPLPALLKTSEVEFRSRLEWNLKSIDHKRKGQGPRASVRARVRKVYSKTWIPDHAPAFQQTKVKTDFHQKLIVCPSFSASFARFGRCNVNMKDGYGFVVYDYPPNAHKALQALQGRNICGKPLTLTWSNKQPRPFKNLARVDQTYDREPLRMRNSARGGDYGSRNFDLNVQPDCKTSVEQTECHGTELNSADRLNAYIDYHQDHVKQFIREDDHGYKEDLLNEDAQDEPNQMDDRWDGQRNDHSNGNDIEHEIEFDRYVGHDRKADDENHQIVYYSGCPAEKSPQERIVTKLIGEETLNHPKDAKLLQACYSCGALGHKKHNCPHEITSGRYSSRKAYGSGKSGRLRENRSSFIGKETDRAWENDTEGKKRSRWKGGTPQRHNAKKERPISSPLHPDYSASRSRSKSKSIMHMPRSISQSRSRSVSSRARTSSKNLRLSSRSHYSRSRSSKSSSRSNSPTSFSSTVSLGRPSASLLDMGQFNLQGSLDKANTESKGIMVGGDVHLENAKFDNNVAPVTVENAGSSAKVESEVEKDQAMPGGNCDNHMTPRSLPQVKNPSTPLSEKSAPADESLSPENLGEIKGSQDFDALTTEDVMVQPVETDSDISVRSTSVSPEELCMVMKHYGLEPPNENERHLSAEDYFGAARMWPWEIIYYRRLKKGPISTENYARQVAQNKEFGIVDKYIGSSSGWGELDHL
ncbi:hypothetical protein V6N13_009496 [Hibiscus sabdariffa]